MRDHFFRVFFLAILGSLALTALIFFALLASVQSAMGSGPVTVTFEQPGDCEVIAGWELYHEPQAGAGVLPSPTAFGISIPNAGPIVCGPPATTVQAAVGVGLHRFWLRALATGGERSEFSNFKDTPLPFARPVLVSVGS